MRVFRIVMVLALLGCAVPLVSVVLAAAVAQTFGCTLNEGSPSTCLIGGVDFGRTLYSMGVMGWLILATLPLAAVLALIWAIVEGVRWRRGSRAAGPDA